MHELVMSSLLQVDYSHAGECQDYLELSPWPVEKKWCGYVIGMAPGEGKYIAFEVDQEVKLTMRTNEYSTQKGFHAVFANVPI